MPVVLVIILAWIGWELGSHLDVKAAGSLLVIFGFIFSFATSIQWLIFRKVDESPPKDLVTPKRRQYYESQMRKRKSAVWWGIGQGCLLTVLTPLIGWGIQNEIIKGYEAHLMAVGVVLLGAGILFAIRAVREFTQISDRLKQVTKKLEDQKRKNDLLEKLHGSKPNAAPSK